MPVSAHLNRPLRVCIASHYALGSALYNRLVFEACASIATMAETTIVAPGSARHGAAWKAVSLARHATRGVPFSGYEHKKIDEDFDLFLFVGMRPQDLICLKSIEGWRERSRIAAAFLFETWTALVEEKRNYYRLLKPFDEVFLFNAGSVATARRVSGTGVSHLPAAVDCLAATPWPKPGARPIDVVSIGRTHQRVHEQLVEMTSRQELNYLWDLPPGTMTFGYPEARFRTYHLIRQSRYFTSFNFKIDAAKTRESRGEDTVPARVFEGAAAGAVMIGTAPTVPEFQTLFDWPDAIIEIPLDPVDMPAFYAEIEAQPQRIRRAGILNAARSLRKHDWAYRFEEMLRRLDLPVPAQVAERKARLADLADRAEAELELRPWIGGRRSRPILGPTVDLFSPATT